MAIANSSTAINAAFLLEIKEYSSDYLGRVSEFRALIEEWDASMSAAKICTALTQLCDTFSEQFQLEETYGFVQRAKGADLKDCELAHQLLVQHRLILATQVDISERVSSWSYCGFIEDHIDEIREQTEACFELLRQHDELELELIQSKIDQTHFGFSLSRH